MKLLTNVQFAIDQYESLADQSIQKYSSGTLGKDKFISIFTKGGEAHTLATSADNAMQELIDYNITYAALQIEENEQISNTSIIVMIIVLAIGVALAIGLGLFISRGISAPISNVVDAAAKLAKGDIDVVLDKKSKDETGLLVDTIRNLVASTREQVQVVELIADGDLTVEVPVRSDKDILGIKLSQMVANLNELISSISVASEQVSAGAHQISNSSMALSQGATEQASSIEELSASIEEVSANTSTNADNAAKANDLADNTKAHALTGNEHMKDMLVAMDEINEASGNINRIIKVIDDIAFQTNILALNAAVEAARAGQHGKGFAVVAEEVRTLAGRSASAVKETTNLIEDSIKKSEAGAKIANQTAEALAKIVTGVESVSNLIGDIKRASVEQATAISQIKVGITQVSQVVQENSATSEESAAASEELSGQAEGLKRMIERFRLKKTGII